MVITIDGLSTNGKTTLATRIAEKLNFKNFNTGAIYRCIALTIIKNNVDIDNIDNVLQYINNMKIDFEDKKIYLDNVDVTKEIYTEEIDIYSTKWASIYEIKNFVRNFQKQFIEKNDTVMEGRDIGTRIAPNADIKFYLYSDIETRAQRLCIKNKSENINDAKKYLKEIDEMDINDKLFIKPEGAIEIDTNNYSLDEVYEIMMNEIDKKLIK